MPNVTAVCLAPQPMEVTFTSALKGVVSSKRGSHCTLTNASISRLSGKSWVNYRKIRIGTRNGSFTFRSSLCSHFDLEILIGQTHSSPRYKYLLNRLKHSNAIHQQIFVQSLRHQELLSTVDNQWSLDSHGPTGHD